MLKMIALALGIAALLLPCSPQFDRIGMSLSPSAISTVRRVVMLDSRSPSTQLADDVLHGAEEFAWRDTPRPLC